MSAFVVNDETINRFLAWAECEEIGNQHMLRSSVERFRAAYLWPELGEAMARLNVQSVSQRYNDPNVAFTYRYKHDRIPTLVQALKLLNCWLYQSCEGVCFKEGLFIMAEALKVAMYETIVADLPEYQAADWDAKR